MWRKKQEAYYGRGRDEGTGHLKLPGTVMTRGASFMEDGELKRTLWVAEEAKKEKLLAE